MFLVTSAYVRELRVDHNQYQSTDSYHGIDSDHQVITSGGLRNSGLISKSAEFFQSVACDRSSSTGIRVRQIIRGDAISTLKPQVFWIHSLQLADFGSLINFHRTPNFSPARAGCSPSINFSVCSKYEEREARLYSFNVFPAQRVRVNRINYGQPLVEKDDFWSSNAQSKQNDKEKRPEGRIDGMVFAAAVPLACRDPYQKKIKSSQYPIATGGSKHFRVSAVARAHHVAIVSQKVEN